MRRWNWLVVGVLAIMAMTMALAVRRSTAQDDNWAAILHDETSGLWTKTTATGVVHAFELSTETSEVAINHTGTRLAYCAIEANHATLRIYDPDEQLDLLTVDLGPAVGCYLGANAFTSDGTQVWVGLAGAPAVDQLAWQLIEVQTSDGTVTTSLDSNATIASIVEVTGGPMMPYVYAADGGQVVFGVLPFGIGGTISVPAYAWAGADELTPLTGWGNDGADGLLSTGEVVWPAFDPARPSAPAEGPMPIYNVINYQAANGELAQIYHNPDWLINGVRWVNGGQQIVVSLLSPAGAKELRERWVVVSRDGTVEEFSGDSASSVDILDSRDGYAVLKNEPKSPSAFQVTLTRYMGATSQAISTSEETNAWQLVWVTPSTPATNLSPFVPFGANPTPTATFEAAATLTTFPSATPTAGLTSTPTGELPTLRVLNSATPTAQLTNTPTRSATNVSASPTNTSIPRPNTATPTVGTIGTRANSPTPRVTNTAIPSVTKTNTPSVSRTPTTRPASATPLPPRSTSVPSTNTLAASTATPRPNNPAVTASNTPRSGQLASRTPTSGAPQRPTNTIVPPTRTSAPPTATRTATPRPTNTSVPPTPTRTPTAVLFPSKTPINGPTSTLSHGGNAGTVLRITNQAGTDLCEVYFTLNTETTWGQNHLDTGEKILDQASREWVVEPGIYDVSVYDCFGNTLEEYGFDLTAGSLDVQVSANAMTGVPIR